MARKQSLPRTTKAKLGSLLYTTHWWWEMPHKDPKVQLAAELGPQNCTLQEQFPGVPTQAQSQKRAQSGCWLRPRQLLNGKLACANNPKAASQPEFPMLGMSLVRLPFVKEQPFCWNLIRSFLTCKKRDCKKQLAKIKFCCMSIYKHCWKHVLNGRFWETGPKGQFHLICNLQLGKKSQLIT